MGHVAALRRSGIPASAPLFIPGLGAFVRLHMSPPDARTDARIRLAGPVWGLGAAVAAYLAYLATGAPIWAAITHVRAFLNLFNLLPIWQFDGGRGFHALTRTQRGIAAAFVAGAWAVRTKGFCFSSCWAPGGSSFSLPRSRRTTSPWARTWSWSRAHRADGDRAVRRLIPASSVDRASRTRGDLNAEDAEEEKRGRG